MSEHPTGHEEFDEIPLDRDLVIGRLQELGVGIETEDIEGLDDNELMGLLVTYADMYGFDMDDVLPQVTPIDGRTRNDGGITLAMIHEEDEYEV